jgi:hypothetical protein
MRLTILPFLFLLFFTTYVFAQKTVYSVLTIPDSLKQNANAVVRLSTMEINIVSQKSMILKSTQVTTVLNELGLNSLNLSNYYDKNRRITKIEVSTYDAFGKELKSYKRKDFKEHSVNDSGTMFSDTRLIDLDYTPTTYPFTIIEECEIETSNTAFIPWWSPSDGYLVSTENTSLTVTFKPELHIRKKEVNFSTSFNIDKKETLNSISYASKNLKAKKREELSPSFTSIFPMVYLALENFQLENVEGNATNWLEFGKWYYNSLLSDTEDIPEKTQIKIKQLVGDQKDVAEIAKIVYKYVQEKTRYVSIQVGIGGWKPMLAKEVDKLGYGDCKALTNYTRSLLKVVGVESYFTLVYAGENETKDLQSDFASVQGNHAILTLPIDKKLLWLECTSQIQPFGFQGDFTDDRNVLLVKPEGGEIVKTKTFTEADNYKKINGSFQITEHGDFTGKVNIVSKGLKYDNEFGKERMSRENQIKNYKEEFNTINNLSITEINFKNNPNTIEFTEDLLLTAEGYAQNSGGKLMFALNAFDQDSYVPKKYRVREFPFEIQRGYTNEDEIEISIPEGFSVEAKPNGIEQTNEFGSYKIAFTSLSSNKILCQRKLVIKKGLYDKTKYEEYRKFREIIAKNDNSKVVIAKN